MPLNEHRVRKLHLLGYALVIILLIGAAVVAPTVDHRGTPSLHTLWEAVATVLALVAGAFAMVRYHARQDLPYLFIGAGLIGAGVLDGFHAWSSSVYAYRTFPTPLDHLSLWGWLAARLYLGAMLLLAGWAWWWCDAGEQESPVGAREVFTISGAVIAAIFAVFLFVPLPPSIFQNGVPRPQEFVAALLYGGALAGFIVMGRWRREPAEHWIVQSLIVAIALHLLLVPFSEAAWDTRFDLGHLLKIVSYGLIFVGLLVNVRSLHRTILEEERRLSETNRRLEEEVALRSATEASAAGEKHLLESIFDSLSDGLVVVDSSGQMSRFNKAAERIVGMPMTLLPSTAWTEHYGVFHGDENTPMKTEELPPLRALRGKTVQEQHIFIKNEARPEGIHLNVSTGPVRDANGKILGSVVIFRDVTTQHRVQEQLRRYTAELERRNRDLQDFATIVSHDLKEPLRKVLAFGERLDTRIGDAVDEEARDYLRRMRHGAERMRTLIDDLLAYTRLGQKDHLEEVDLKAIADRAVADLDERIAATDALVEVTEIGRVECDPVQMYHVFVNLIGNGLKYHREGVPPRVVVSGSIEHDTCTIRVEDNGIGFDMKYAQRIFRPFHRLHTRSEYEGSGIGLAIVRKVVEHHGGSISVDSTPGQGTVFTVEIPIHQSVLEVQPTV